MFCIAFKILVINIKKTIVFLLFFFVFFNSRFAYAQNSFVQDSIQERTYSNKGREEGRKGDFEKAELYYKKALVLGIKLYGENDTKVLQSHINLGIQQKNLGKYDDAIQSYSKAEELIKSIYGEEDARLGMIYGNAGLVFKSKGDYSKALEYQESALRALAADSSKYANFIRPTEFNLAVSLKNLNRLQEAIKIANKNIKGKYHELIPRHYVLLAEIYSEKNNNSLAEKYYQESIKSWIRYHNEETYGLGETYNNYASFLIKTRKYDSAWVYNERAEKIISNTYGSKSTFYSHVQNNYGDIYLNRDSEAVSVKDFRRKKKGNILKALGHYQKASVAVVEGYNNDDFLSLPPIDEAISEIQLLTVLKKKATAFELLAEIYQAEMDYENYLRFNVQALQTINSCINLIHRLRIGYLNEESKLLLAEKQESTFMDAISIAYHLYRFTKEKQYLHMAFEFTEKSKSASFLASVKDMEAKQFGGIPDSLLAREEYLKINISNYKELLFQENQQGNPDSQKTRLYSSKIFQHNEEYNQLISLFEKKYPQYYSFKYENKVITIDEVQRRLKKKDAVIEYVVNEPISAEHPGQVYRFTITKDKVDLSMEPIGVEHVNHIENLYDFLSNTAYLYTRKKDFIAYCISANQLYNTLLAPVSGLISGKSLIVVPDDKLSYIPFDALLSAMPDTSKMDFRKLDYLVYDYPINYSYSSTLLFNYFEADKQAPNKLLAFAPDYKLPDGVTTGHEQLMPLPGAKTEVEQLNRYIASDIFVGSMASEKNFKEFAPRYDILHLAMHTILNDSLPMFSRLAFTSPAEGDTEDGWLNTHEIYNMKLNARMAVLSACNTGKGKLQKGEGVMSLARGFLYAGCPSIVMTLWEVEDLSGTEIMRNFYNLLSKGKNKNDALRLSKLKHIQDADPLKAHPHYWLGYVNIGNSEPLYNSNDIYFVLVMAFVLVLITLDQLFRKRGKTRNPK